jgi:hypothetical protein
LFPNVHNEYDDYGDGFMKVIRPVSSGAEYDAALARERHIVGEPEPGDRCAERSDELALFVAGCEFRHAGIEAQPSRPVARPFGNRGRHRARAAEFGSDPAVVAFGAPERNRFPKPATPQYRRGAPQPDLDETAAVTAK